MRGPALAEAKELLARYLSRHPAIALDVKSFVEASRTAATARRSRLATGWTAMFAACAFCGFIAWDRNLRIKTVYCANYAERFMVTECVGRLAESARDGEPFIYKIRSKGGRVVEMARISAGETLRHPDLPQYEPEHYLRAVALRV